MQLESLEHDFYPKNKEVPEIVLKQLKAIHTAAYKDSAKITEDEWREDRRHGLGGSDISAMIGDSPFSNNWELFLDKTGIAEKDLSENWFRLEYGHATESLIAKLFAKKFHAIVINETGMFKHPEYDFVRANLDRLGILPTGELVILECKSTNPFGRTQWTNGAPLYYAWQGRQYLCVINAILTAANLPLIRKVYFSALYGNTEEDAIYRKIEWDAATEKTMLESEKDFWLNYVVKRKLPQFNSSFKALKELSLVYRLEIADLGGNQKPEDAVEMADVGQTLFDKIQEIKAKESKLKKQMEVLAEDRAALEVSFIGMMEGSDKAVLPCGYTASINVKKSRSVNYGMMEELYPEAYRECVSSTECKPMLSFKKPEKEKKKKVAAATSGEVA